MASDTLTLKLNGDVSLSDYAKAITRFNALVHGLTKAVAPSADIDWTVVDLQPGSATATTLGTAPTLEPLLQVRHAYLSVGEALEADGPVGYTTDIEKAALGIRSVLNGRITEAVFETFETEVIVHSAQAQPQVTTRKPFANKGAIAGRIQTLSSRGGLRFTLYDLVNDRAISCYLAEGREDLLRDAWGRLAIVEGIVRRDPLTGRALAIRQVASINIRPDPDPDAFRAARGAIPWRPDAPLPEDVIRRMRDA